jgi:hypothetical protein
MSLAKNGVRLMLAPRLPTPLCKRKGSFAGGSTWNAGPENGSGDPIWYAREAGSTPIAGFLGCGKDGRAVVRPSDVPAGSRLLAFGVRPEGEGADRTLQATIRVCSAWSECR